jgi:hypothetical protein
MSLTLTKFFTPPLEAKEKREIFEILGLNDWELYFAETTKELLLRVVHYHGLRSRVLLEPGTLKEWQELKLRSDIPTLELLHQMSQAHQVSQAEKPVGARSLLESILPFPFNLLGRKIAGDPFVSIEGELFSQNCQALHQNLNALEAELMQTEVGIAWLQDDSKSFPLLLHSVRGRKIRVGTGPLAQRAGELFERGNLTETELFSIFGATATFIPVDAMTLQFKRAALRGGPAGAFTPSWL